MPYYKLQPSSLIKTYAVEGPTTSTSGVLTANNIYLGTIQILYGVSLTGIRFYKGATAAGNVLVGLYDSSGNLLASSNSTALSGTFAVQSVPFTATYFANPGIYFLGFIPSTSSDTFALTASFGLSSTAAAGGFSLPSTVTPPANGGAYIPQLSTY